MAICNQAALLNQAAWRRSTRQRCSPAKQAKAADSINPDHLREITRLTYRQNKLAAQLVARETELGTTKAALAKEEERSTQLLHTALGYRHKWLQAATNPATLPDKRGATITEHHKNEAKRLAIAANAERDSRLEAYNNWRIQEHYSATRLQYPLLHRKMQQLLTTPPSTPRHPFKDNPCGAVIYSL